MNQASSSQHAKDWIIVLGSSIFLAHPRGTRTPNRSEAHGWHYKKEALAESKSHLGSKVERRGQ